MNSQISDSLGFQSRSHLSKGFGFFVHIFCLDSGFHMLIMIYVPLISFCTSEKSKQNYKELKIFSDLFDLKGSSSKRATVYMQVKKTITLNCQKPQVTNDFLRNSNKNSYYYLPLLCALHEGVLEFVVSFWIQSFIKLDDSLDVM